MKRTKDVKNDIAKFAEDLGFDLFAVADISKVKDEIALSKKTLKSFDRAIVMAMRVAGGILSEMDHPTRLYFHHYKTLNATLDQAALRVANFLQRRGFQALPIPASQIVDWQKQTAHLSHKKLGVLAGLGWIGRNNLLVNKTLGSQFRLVTILTDAPLQADEPTKEGCGTCVACVKLCPAKAIKAKASDFDHLACFEKLKDFQKMRYVDQYICGVCVKACNGKGK